MVLWPLFLDAMEDQLCWKLDTFCFMKLSHFIVIEVLKAWAAASLDQIVESDRLAIPLISP